ncbi:MAG: hypothetical protein M0R18_06365 [Deltaproteobacteria bacterium]|jgi:uncharacterized SAM-binding protein YcdF (DUF218 family)|nr:hypothetical protein [Deltaproteobacteria bacterium]
MSRTPSPDRRYPRLGVQWVVVLAGGHVSNESLPVTSQLLDETLVRLAEGIRIQQNLPGARLLVSGGCISSPRGMRLCGI